MDNEEINLFDQIEELDKADPDALAEFKREMTEKVIPEIAQVVEERRVLAAESRQRQLEVLIAHTPRPWRMNVDYLTEPTMAYISAINADNEIVATVYRESDARLIAAAPELLAACQAFIEAVSPTQAHYDLMKAAIAKATGEK